MKLATDRYRIVAAFVGVLLLGLGLRLIHISDPYLIDYHGWRQSDTAAFTHRYLNDTLNPFDPRVDRYPCEHRARDFGRVEAELPVGAWLAALPLALARVTCPPAPYLRAVSIAFFLGTCLYLFGLVRRLTGRASTGVVSVVVLSILPVSIYFTRTVQPEPMSLFFSVACLFHLLCWLKNGKIVQAVLSAALGALALLQKIPNAVIIIPAAQLIISHQGWLGSIRRGRYWLWAIGVVGPAAIWLLKVRSYPWSFGIWGSSGKFSTWAVFANEATWKFHSDRLLFVVLSWSALLLLVFGCTRYRQSSAVRLAVAWLSAQFLFFILTLPAHRPHVYYHLPIALPASVLIAIGAERLWQQRLAGKSALAGLVLLHVLQTVHVLGNGYYGPQERLREGIELLRRQVPAQATLLSVERDPRLFSNSCHKGWFVRTPQLPAIEACLGKDVEYLLLTTPVRHKLFTVPQSWSRLNQIFTETERTWHFSVWKRRPETSGASSGTAESPAGSVLPGR